MLRNWATPILFLISGALAAAINIGSRFAFSKLMPFSLAIALAFICGLSAAFCMNRTIVFQSRGHLKRQIWIFIVFNLASLLVTLSVSHLMRQQLVLLAGAPAAELIAHTLGVGVAVVPSYYLHRGITFAVGEGE